MARNLVSDGNAANCMDATAEARRGRTAQASNRARAIARRYRPAAP
jgi:hypothetical protein